MIDLLKPSLFPNNVISGVSTGFLSDIEKQSYFVTQQYNLDLVLKARSNLENLYTKEFKSFFYQRQIHSDVVLIDSNLDLNKSLDSDAVISNLPGIIYNVSIADCQAILIYDPIKNVIAAIHSGWKGTNLNITSKTIRKMIVTYNTQPSKLLVYLTPSASADNYEVGNEFLDIFPATTIRIEDKFYFDNRQEILNQLLDSGVELKNIESNNDCTITNNRYHSFRRDKQASGRMSAFIGIKP